MLKGDRCLSSKCAFSRRPYIPGVHGNDRRRPRITDFGKQLREKQKTKRLYGVSETQFSNYYKKAMKLKGDSGLNFVRLLETRLDNVLYRSGFAKSRASARQLVSHAHVSVNGRSVDVPSYSVKAGDVIAIRDQKRQKGPWKTLAEDLQNKELASWLVIQPADGAIKISGGPTEEELKQAFDPKLIIEYYSR